MKLPQVQYRSVQSMGRNNLSTVGAQAGAAQQQGGMMQQAMESIADVTSQYIERQENQQYNEQVANYSIEINEWQSRHNAKQFYTADELDASVPESVVPRVVSGTLDNGDTYTERRDNIPAYEVYPHLLKNKLQGMIKTQAEQIANPNLRNAFIEKASVDAAAKVMQATITAEKAQQEYTYREGINRADEAASSGNLAMAQFIIENLETDDVTKAELMKVAENKVEKYQVFQAIRSTDPETVLSMRALLEDPNYAEDSALNEDERQAAVNDLNSRLAQLGNERKMDLVKEHEAFISDFNVGIDEYALGMADIEEGYQLWLKDEADPRSISGTERTALRARINARNNAAQVQKDYAAIGAHAIEHGGNHANSDQQKGIDAYVAENNITDLRQLEWITLQSGIMPQVLEDFLNNMALHNAEKGAEQIPQALQVFGRLVDQGPHLVREMSKDSKDLMLDAHFMNKGGVDPVEAYTIARQNQETPQDVKDGRLERYREQRKDMNFMKMLSDYMDDDNRTFGFEGMVWRQADPHTDMADEFGTLMERFYVLTNDIERSKQLAWTSLQETWSPTGVGSRFKGLELQPSPVRAFKYSPERVMQVSTEVAQKRLDAFAKDQGLENEALQIVWDAQTARDGSWQVWVLDEETHSGSPWPKRWVGHEWATEAANNSYADAVTEAQKERAARDEVEAEFLKAQEWQRREHERMFGTEGQAPGFQGPESDSKDQIDSGGVRG